MAFVLILNHHFAVLRNEIATRSSLKPARSSSWDLNLFKFPLRALTQLGDCVVWDSLAARMPLVHQRAVLAHEQNAHWLSDCYTAGLWR